MMPANPKDYLELLEVFRIGLATGVLEKKQVTQWADAFIQQDAEPDYLFIELALAGSGSVNDLIAIIQAYIGTENSPFSGRVILGVLYKQYREGQLPLQKAVRAIDWIAWQTNLTDEEKHAMYGLEDAHLLAQEGVYGTEMEAEHQALRVLEVYRDFSLDNASDWQSLHAAIAPRMQVLVRDTYPYPLASTAPVIVKNAPRPWWRFW